MLILGKIPGKTIEEFPARISAGISEWIPERIFMKESSGILLEKSEEFVKEFYSILWGGTSEN